MEKSIEYIDIEIDKIMDYEKNPRKISEAELLKLKNSLDKFGYVEPVIIDDKNVLIGGHQRVKALRALNYTEKLKAVKLSGYKQNEKKALNIALNKISGEWNLPVLEELLNELKLENFDIDLTGFDNLDFKELDLHIGEEKSEGELNDVPEITKEAVSKLGDLFIIDGRHRLLCGDSTKKEDVSRLMDGKKADMVFTDPPYGVSYAAKNKYLNTIARGNRIQTEIINDHKNIEELKENIIFPAFCRIKEHLNEYSSYYITAPQGGDLLMMMMMMQKAGLLLRHMLIWSKNNHVLGRTDYNYKHEPILFGWVEKHKFYGQGEYKFSVWNIDKPHKSELHPTMKPIKLVKNAVNNSSLKDNIILDLFLGSGTTLIACEETGRICHGMELSPQYCDVIIRRYNNLYPDKKIECINREFDFNYLFKEKKH